MFVYQQNGCLKITFDDNKPVSNPAISIDYENNELYVNGDVIPPITSEELLTDVVLPTAKLINTPVTVLLNGNTISAPEDTAGDGVYHVVTGGYLTINGDGVINGVANNDYNMAIWADGGNVVINGGTFTNKGATAESDSEHFDLIYAKNGSIVEINNGFFDCETPKWTLNLNDKNPGKFIVRGGSFVGFDPSKAETEPNQPVSFVADGYAVRCEDNIYTVYKI